MEICFYSSDHSGGRYVQGKTVLADEGGVCMGESGSTALTTAEGGACMGRSITEQTG